MSQMVKKCSISQCRRILQKFLDQDPDADDFRNLITSFSCPQIHLWQDFHEYPVTTYYVNVLTERQTDR